jgi:phosphopentomutase
MSRRVFLIVLDGMGVGGAHDAAAFGDSGSDTLGHLAHATQLHCPTLTALGLGNLYADGLPGLPRIERPLATVARLTELSAGKDTTTGHWELMGIVRDRPSPTFPEGFPPEFIAALEAAIGRGVLCNRPYSGTQVIADFGGEHMATGQPIVYTSADSVLQIATHVEVIPLAELYRICEVARVLAIGPVGVDRVIARPFNGDPRQGFSRTPDRRDYSIPPPDRTVLDALKEAGRDVIGVGKIGDIFAMQGLTETHPVHGNAELMAKTAELAGRDFHGLVFVNLVDFDMLYGHRNDPAGMAAALNEFDAWLSRFIGLTGGEHPSPLREDDLLIITADHGNDPTTGSTDHSREQVPVLVFRPGNPGKVVETEPGFYHVGATVAAWLGVQSDLPGQPMIL